MTVDQITALANLFTSLGFQGLQTFLKLKSLMNLTDDEKTNIANAINQANEIDQDTIDKAEAWKVANGFVN